LVQTTPDIGLSGAVCTPGVTSSQMVRSSSENDSGEVAGRDRKTTVMRIALDLYC